MNMKDDNSVNQTSFNSKQPEAPQIDIQTQENLHTKVQCQNQQLQHLLLQKHRKDIETGIILHILGAYKLNRNIDRMCINCKSIGM